MHFAKHLSFIILLFFLTSCCTTNQEPKELKSIKTAFKDNFLIGAAINANQIEESDTLVSSLISKEFNSITPENIMKSMYVHPAKDTFFFNMTDKYVALGEKNNMYIQGHTLIWHSQLAPWFLEIKDSTEMAETMKNHINTIVTRYKGRINGWDVVNEALNDDGTLRESVFLNTIGEDYIDLAFKLTAKADPEADLYYNDYSMTNDAKRKGAIVLIKKLQEKGIKIDGVGMQAHFDLNSPSLEKIEQSILEYAALGIKVAFTEFDINVAPNPWDFKGADVNVKFENTDPTMNPYPESLPDSIQNKLAKRYQDIFKILIKHQDKISRVTFWGVGDGDSWKNDWPVKGRTDYPLLFDRNYKPKKAYYSILELKETKSDKK